MSDEVFVGRCRVVAAGVLRVAALAGTIYLAIWVGIELYQLKAGYRFMDREAQFALVLLLMAGLAATATSWFLAPWFSRHLFPMPADRNQCPKCKYPLEGLTGEKCPECGAKVR